MATEADGAGIPPDSSTLTWRELAVARSLDPARARAESRVQRYLDAALELMDNDPDREFTVQEVVERSGQSLRGFYQYFAGKYELLLALFEESVRSTAAHLERVIAEEHAPLDRLHRFAVEYYRMCSPSPAEGSPATRPRPAAMADFAQQLLTSHPKEAARAFTPLVSLLEALLDDAAAAHVVRPGLRHARIAGVVLQAVMFNAFATTISGSSSRSDGDDAEGLWELLLLGIGTGATA